MIKGKDFIFTGLQPWDLTIGSNARDIAYEVSKHNRVIYVSTPLDKSTFRKADNAPENRQRKAAVTGKGELLRTIIPNRLWVLDYPFTIWPVNFLPDGILFDTVNRINNRKMYSFVRKAIGQLGFKDYILFIDNDIYKSFYAKEYLNPAFTLYYRRDNMISAYWEKHAPRLEPLLCRKADVVVANSLQLAEAVSPYNPKAFDVGQGVDLSNYSVERCYPIPGDIKDIPKPVIGYVGWITSRRLDADLLADIARQRPGYSFVMVGKEDEYFRNHPLHNEPNVFFPGEKKVDKVVDYMASFDVCMNPQKINEVTIGNYPRKIDEYLALGKPVIATRTKTMELFDAFVWNCEGAEEYVTAIDEALNSNSPENIEKRIRFAHTHTWENSVKKIYSHITL